MFGMRSPLMAETGIERDVDGATNPGTDPGTDAGTRAAPPVALTAPAPGQQIAVAVQAGQTLVLDPGARGFGLEHSGADLSIVFTGAGTIRLEGFAALAESAAPPRLVLPDGSALSADGLLALLDGGPEEAPPIETAAGTETGAGETLSSGGGSAYDDDLGGPSVAGLAALGALDAATESGVSNSLPAEDREGPTPASAAVTVTASDGEASAAAGFNLTVGNVDDAPSAGAAAGFNLTVENVNDAPIAGAIGDVTTDEDQAFVYDVSAGFSDPDVGDTLGYSATLAGGAPLPGWLSIDPVSGILSGTPDNGDVGAYTVTVTASDGEASAAADFTLTVDNVNDAPIAGAIGDVTTDEDQAFV
ncbi:MAG: putative Ig domain-containing protein, partial [Proteobacteria bacterium]|nr:putative Ig domain-containing protein [Pseudomonadota bacterium]